jgi:hypothetical protein
MAAAVGIVIVAAAFAVFSLLQAYLGPSGAAAIIAAVIAVLLAAAALLVLSRADVAGGMRRGAAPAAGVGMQERIIYLIQDRPLLAAGAAVAAGLIAWRNPRLIGSVMSLFSFGRGRV